MKRQIINIKYYGVTIEALSHSGTLLEIVESNGLKMKSNCRVGVCGTCKITVKSNDGRICIKMACTFIPKTHITIE